MADPNTPGCGCNQPDDGCGKACYEIPPPPCPTPPPPFEPKVCGEPVVSITPTFVPGPATPPTYEWDCGPCVVDRTMRPYPGMLFGYADMLAQCVPCLTGTGITEPVRLALAAFIDSIICCKFQGYRLAPDNANGNLVTDFSNPDPFEDIPNVMTRGLIPKFGPECLRQLAQWPAMDHVRINIAARYGMRSAPLGNQCDMPLPLIEQELRWWVHLRDTIKVAT